MASAAAILAVVNLCLAMASNQSMAFLVFVGMINLAVIAAVMMRGNPESSSASSSQESSSTSSSSSSSGINHEVFLNFRGEDTRRVFTDVLRRDLENAGIVVFHDAKSLLGGEEIDQALKDAIKRSRISIAIFSKDYASSRSCLMELVQMWECSQSDGQIIIPVFYDVTPSDVKNQAGAFAKSFKSHKANKKVHDNSINEWKGVLQLVGGLKGYEMEKMGQG